MGDLNVNEQALQNIFDRLLQRFGHSKLGFDPSTVGTSQVNAIDQIWAPPIPPGFSGAGLSGSQLGYLRYLPRNPSSALRFSVGYTSYSLTLDPEWTAPNARINVFFGTGAPQKGAWLTMRPGTTIQVPAGFTTLLMYNGDGMEQWFDLVNRPLNANLGFCRFLVGRTPNAYPVNLKEPTAQASIIQAGVVGSIVGILQNAATLGFSTHNIKAIRVTCNFLSAANANVANGAAAIKASYVQRYGSVVAPFAAPSENETADIISIAANSLDNDSTPAQTVTGFGNLSSGESIVIPIPKNTFGAQLHHDGNIYAGVGGVPATQLFVTIEGLTDNPILGAQEEVVIYDFTAAAAANNDTGALPTADFETLCAWATITGALSGVPQIFEIDDGGIPHSIYLGGAGIAVGEGQFYVGPPFNNHGDLAAAPAVAVLPVKIHRRMRFLVNGAAGSTIRLRVKGTRRSYIG